MKIEAFFVCCAILPISFEQSGATAKIWLFKRATAFLKVVGDPAGRNGSRSVAT
jgi:hypothetical protein